MKTTEPLRMVSGPDRVLNCLWPLAACIGVVALFRIELGFQQRLAPAMLIIVAMFFSQFLWRRDDSLDVLLLPDDRLRWRKPGGEWQLGSRNSKCWASRRYAVISATVQGNRRQFLISRSRQDAKTYKMLVARIRLASNAHHPLK